MNYCLSRQCMSALSRPWHYLQRNPHASCWSSNSNWGKGVCVRSRFSAPRTTSVDTAKSSEIRILIHKSSSEIKPRQGAADSTCELFWAIHTTDVRLEVSVPDLKKRSWTGMALQPQRRDMMTVADKISSLFKSILRVSPHCISRKDQSLTLEPCIADHGVQPIYAHSVLMSPTSRMCAMVSAPAVPKVSLCECCF